MEKFITATSKTIDLAIENALRQLDMDRDSVSVEVLENPKSGFLGFGACPAKVKVTYEVPDEEVKPAPALSSASRSKPKKAEPKVEAPKPLNPINPKPVQTEAPKAEASLSLGGLGLHGLRVDGVQRLGGLDLGLSLLGLAAGRGGQGGSRLDLLIGDFVGHLDLCRAGAEAQEPGLGIFQHFHRHAVPIHIQLPQGIFNGQVNGLTSGGNEFFHFQTPSSIDNVQLTIDNDGIRCRGWILRCF